MFGTPPIFFQRIACNRIRRFANSANGLHRGNGISDWCSRTCHSTIWRSLTVPLVLNRPTETHRRSQTMLLVPLVDVHEKWHWLQSRHSTIWRSQNLPLVHYLAKHNPSGSHELCQWSLYWQSKISLAVPKNGTVPYSGKAWSDSHECCQWSLSWQSMISCSHERWQLSLFWHSMISLAVTKFATGPLPGKA